MKQFTLKSGFAIKAATHIVHLVALITTTLLFCGCLPLAPGKSSTLKDIYALEISRTDASKITYAIGNLALCVDFKGSTACTSTLGFSAGKIASIISKGLHSPAVADERIIQTALDLKAEVFIAIPAIASICLITILITLPSIALNWHAEQLRKISTGLSAVAAFIMLADAFATNRALHGIVIATKISNDIGYVYRAGITWQAMQWVSFIFCTFLTIMVALPGLSMTSRFRSNRGISMGRIGSNRNDIG